MSSYLLAQWIKNPPAMQETQIQFNPRVVMIPWRKKWQPSPEFLPEKSYGQRSLAGYSQRDHKEPNVTEQISMHDILYNKSLFW